MPFAVPFTFDWLPRSRGPLLVLLLAIGWGLEGSTFSRIVSGQQEWTSDAQPRATQLERFQPATESTGSQLALLDASLIQALEESYFKRTSPSALRPLQRAFRTTGPTAESGNVLQEILRITHALRRHDEFIRYAEIGASAPLTDEKLALRAAIQLTDARKYSTAAEYYRQWLQLKSPPADNYLSTVVRMEMGRLLYLAGDYQQAERGFRQVLDDLNSDRLSNDDKDQLLRNSDTTYRMMTTTFLKTGELELAERLLKKTTPDPTSPIQFLYEAQSALARGETDSARDWVLRFIAKQPNHSDAYQLLREIVNARSTGTPDQTQKSFIEELESIRQKFPTGRVLDDLLVNQYVEAGDSEKAIRILRRQRDETLWRDRANRKLLEIALRERDLAGLIEALTIEVDETAALDLVRTALMATAAWLREQSREIAVVLESDARLERRIAAACLACFAARSGHAEYGLTEKACQTLIADLLADRRTTSTQKRQWLDLLGSECLLQDQYRQALLFHRQLLTINRRPDDTWIDPRLAFRTLLNAARCQTGLKDRAAAFEFLDQASELIRQSPFEMHLKAWTHLQFGELHAAVVNYTELLERFGEEENIGEISRLLERARLELAFSCFLLERTTSAREIAEDVWDRNPQGPDLEAFQRNNQKYIRKNQSFLQLVRGVKHGGPFPLGRD